ncbi:DUF4124 domain-containing protein [Rivibacter subsaxonicus]|uniref:Uncharacterized protein DUF4124 n=1 Tax=Rivibacter subsaxonicus TaxID=457575 RepID=A0A4Q7VPN7_9BURK|nr:uncharacterized protein DUF4124 [Rivibacter subsaxonicus]
MMIRPGFRALAIAFALCAVASLAQAQWKWKDASGQVQYSDRPPPNGVADKDILLRPAPPVTRAQPVATPGSAPPAAAASAAAGIDPALEAKKKQADKQLADADAAKKKAEEEKIAQSRAANCQAAQSNLRALQDGQRIARTNEKGERVFLEDAERTREIERARQVVATDCK